MLTVADNVAQLRPFVPIVLRFIDSEVDNGDLEEEFASKGCGVLGYGCTLPLLRLICRGMCVPRLDDRLSPC